MKHYLPGLNGLRAISVLVVILGHLRLKNFDHFAIGFPFSIFFDGALGVNVFFVISGFLITRLLLIEEAENGKISLGNFYIRRAFRIFPAYYTLLLVYLILQLFSVLQFTTLSWLSSLFYFKYVAGGDWESGHFWSLSVEEHFYLLWPALFMAFKSSRKLIAVTVVLGVMLLRLSTYFQFVQIEVLDSEISLFKRADALMIGCLFALYETEIAHAFGKVGRKWFMSPWVIVLLIALLSSDILPNLNLKYNLHLGILLIPFGLGTSHGTLVNLLIAMLMFTSINSRGTWFSFLNLPWMNFIGKLSYSLYLWQQLFFSEKLGVLGQFPVNLLCMVAAALGSYYLIELPFLKIKGRFEVNKTKKRKDGEKRVEYVAVP